MRRLLWFSVGFACACLVAANALPEAALGWVALLCAALTLGLWLLAKRGTPGGAPPARRRLRRIIRVLTLGTAVGLFKSVVSCVLISSSLFAAYKFAGYKVF